MRKIHRFSSSTGSLVKMGTAFHFFPYALMNTNRHKFQALRGHWGDPVE
jgi:hypothetical protein